MSKPKGQHTGAASYARLLVAAIVFLVVGLVGRSVSAATITISPAGAAVSPHGTQVFTATGGVSPYVWSLSANLSGGSITPGGTYTAGATPSVVDVVEVTDSASNTATAPVAVGAGVTVAPASVTLAAGATQTFTAAGGTAPYAWSLTVDGSGSKASITPTGGVYTAGATAGADTVTATDALGNTGTATITVTVTTVVSAGAECSATDTCATGTTCVDGVCCSSACTGQCQACNTAGSVGTCVTIKGPPVGTRPACAQSDPNNVCSSKMCDGTSATSCTSLVGTETSCGIKSCIDGVGTPGAVCQGDGGCETVVPKSCGTYACVADQCATSCTNTSDCSPGNYCDVTTGKCIKGAPLPLDAGADASGSAPVVSSGCSVGYAPRRENPFFVLTALLGGCALCRRRRRD
jgi:hypothetical protein